ncbi:unnamed protein product [Cutaneotrichosporon oleaginosum]
MDTDEGSKDRGAQAHAAACSRAPKRMALAPPKPRGRRRRQARPAPHLTPPPTIRGARIAGLANSENNRNRGRRPARLCTHLKV